MPYLNFLPTFLRVTRRAPIDKLSEDILVDHIISLLDFKDVMALRRVNKFCYKLTLVPVIWKRFFSRLPDLGLPIPKLPPTSRNTKAALSGLEAERLVTRAISLDNNWRCPSPVLYGTQIVEYRRQVLSMVMLPGSHYIVTSERPAGRGGSDGRYTLSVSAMDRRHGIVQLAKMDTITKAYNIQAKYMTVEGVRNIVIAFIRRDFKDPADLEHGINPSDFSGEHIEPPYPMIYEAVCYAVRLDALEALLDTPDLYKNEEGQRRAFRGLGHVVSEKQFGPMSLDEHKGEPFLTIVEGPDIIIFKHLIKKRTSRVKCLSSIIAAGAPNQMLVTLPIRSGNILNIKVIPSCEQILVVRDCKGPHRLKRPFYTTELYNIPNAPKGDPTADEATIEMSSLDAGSLDYGTIEDFTISDHGLSSVVDPSVYPDLTRKLPHHPISIYGRSITPTGFFHITFWPEPIPEALGSAANPPPIDDPLPYIHYPLSEARLQTHSTIGGTKTLMKVHVLPGSSRALVYTTPADNRTDAPPILGFYSYVSPENRAAEDEPQSDVAPGPNSNPNRVRMREILLMRVAIPPEVETIFKRGVTAITWDEGIGRACVSAVNDSNIYILDFAQSPREDNSGVRSLPFA